MARDETQLLIDNPNATSMATASAAEKVQESAAYQYAGTELDLFLKAKNWKRYWADQVKQYLHGDVLEVGAGAGANIELFSQVELRSWTALEPDPVLAGKIHPALQEKLRRSAGLRPGALVTFNGD